MVIINHPEEGTMTAQATTRTRKPRTPKDAPQRPTVTDQEYLELLAIRLGAMKGFAKGTVDATTKNLARAAVRKARIVRKDEAEVISAWNEWEAAEPARKEAEKAAKPRRTRTKKPVTEASEPVTEPSTDPVLDEAEAQLEHVA
jgi:hypothetical protein